MTWPPVTRRISAAIGAILAVGAVAGLGIAAASAAGAPRWAWSVWLVPPAVVAFVLGIGWSIAVVTSRGGVVLLRQARYVSRSPDEPTMRRLLVGDLGDRAIGMACLLIGSAFVLGIAAFSSLTGTSITSPDCRFAVNDHGSTVCVSEHAWDRARSAEQQLAAGWFGVTLGLVALVATSGAVPRRD